MRRATSVGRVIATRSRQCYKYYYMLLRILCKQRTSRLAGNKRLRYTINQGACEVFDPLTNRVEQAKTIPRGIKKNPSTLSLPHDDAQTLPMSSSHATACQGIRHCFACPTCLSLLVLLPPCSGEPWGAA